MIPSPDQVKQLLERQGPSREIPQRFADDVKALAPIRNPRNFHERLIELLNRYDMDPSEELIRMVLNEDRPLDPGLRAKILMDLQQYLMPKLKAVELTGKVDHQHTINIIRYGEDGTVKREAVKADPVINVDQVREAIEEDE